MLIDDISFVHSSISPIVQYKMKIILLNYYDKQLISIKKYFNVKYFK
jgi:hypothetical protein